MPHPQVMFMLRLLAAVGWADGELAPSEVAALERLIGASDLDEDERAQAQAWLTSAVDLDSLAVDSLNDNQRLAAYQAAVRMAHSDAVVADAEREFLDRARSTLGVDAGRALEIEAEMPRHD